MKIKRIEFISTIEKNANPYDNMVEVLVTLENNFTYDITILTPQYLTWLMSKDKVNFIEPGFSFIIVEELTGAIIRKVIREYAKDNSYWLRLQHFEDEIPLSVLEDLEMSAKKRIREFEEEIRSLELQSSKMESSKQVLVPSEKKLFNNSQVIPRLTWLITVIYLSLIINNRFQNY